jgi:hypothetical protein
MTETPLDGTLETIDGRSTLRFERRYRHGVERVWRAVSERDELEHWFPLEGEPEVTASEPPHLLELLWFGDALRFELRSDGDGCVLVFTHAFADPETAARSAAGWDRCFVRLVALLDGEPIDARSSLEHWPELHERYAEHFGVDPEIGRRAFAEYTPT